MNSKNLKVIDMRFRPPYKSFQKDNIYDYCEDAVGNTWMLAVKGLDPSEKGVSQALVEKSMDRLIEEMDEAGVVMSVTPIRKTCNPQSCGDNQDLVQLMQDYPGRFLGVAGLDPWHMAEALEDIDKYVLNGPCVAVAMEPGQHFIQSSMPPNAEMLYPIYEKCQEENVLLSLTFGGQACANLRYYNPEYLDALVRTFPKLRLVINHGGWPNATAACLIAMQYKNVYLSPDHYMHAYAPGHEAYVDAANGFLRKRIVYGTTYPLGPRLIYHVENFFTTPIRDEVLPDIMYHNAMRMFGLE